MKHLHKEMTMQLKVCEACGGLWVRAGQHGRYCARCVVWLAEFPQPRSPAKSRVRRRPAVTGKSAAAVACGTGGAQ